MKYVIACVLLLAGCGRMQNEEIIAASKKCRDAGYDVQVDRDIYGEVTDIECIPKDAVEHRGWY